MHNNDMNSCCEDGMCGMDMDYSEIAAIGEPVEDFEVDALVADNIKKIKLSDYHGKWVILFFYPGDFTFVCPTELEELAGMHEKFTNLGAEILSISTDSVFVHKAWHDSSDAIKKVNFPMLSDSNHELSAFYNVLIPSEGVALRGTFIIDPDGILRSMEINDNSIGRSGKELLRKLQAAKYVRENGGKVCPASWEPGSYTLEPGLDLVGKI